METAYRVITTTGQQNVINGTFRTFGEAKNRLAELFNSHSDNGVKCTWMNDISYIGSDSSTTFIKKLTVIQR